MHTVSCVRRQTSTANVLTALCYNLGIAEVPEQRPIFSTVSPRNTLKEKATEEDSDKTRSIHRCCCAGNMLDKGQLILPIVIFRSRPLSLGRCSGASALPTSMRSPAFVFNRLRWTTCSTLFHNHPNWTTCKCVTDASQLDFTGFMRSTRQET